MSERPGFIEEKPEVVKEGDSTVSDMAKELRRLTDLKEGQKDELAKTNTALEELSEKLAAKMAAENVDKFFVNGVGHVRIGIDNKPSVGKENEAEFFAYLRENGHGAMVKETVHHSTLLGWVNEMLENNKELPSCVKNYPLKRAKLRRSN